MANKVQVRRGLKKDLKALSLGEFGYTTDTNELYVGSGSGNVLVNDRTLATKTTEGLMSSTDKTKLDGFKTADYYFRFYDLNSINIDSTNGNWTVDISEAGHGKLPPAPWVNVSQTTSTHFYVQTAIEVHDNPNTSRTVGGMWIRDKYINNAWSAWKQIYPVVRTDYAGNISNILSGLTLSRGRITLINGIVTLNVMFVTTTSLTFTAGNKYTIFIAPSAVMSTINQGLSAWFYPATINSRIASWLSIADRAVNINPGTTVTLTAGQEINIAGSYII